MRPVRRDLVHALDFEVFLGWLIHRNLKGRVDRFLDTDHNVEDHIKILVRRVHEVHLARHAWPLFLRRCLRRTWSKQQI